MASALVVVNPRATRLTPRVRDRVVRAADAHWDIEVAVTEGPGHARALAAAAAAAGVDHVLAVGGDGTANEVANGVLRTEATLAPVPVGLTNVFARLVGLPADPVAAVERLGGGEVEQVDVGTVDGRAFLFTSGVGLSGMAARQFDAQPVLKRHLGPVFFMWAAMGAVGRPVLRGEPSLVLHADGRELPGVTFVAQNAHSLSFVGSRPLRVCCGAGLQTGTLSAAVLRRASAQAAVGVPLRLATSRPEIVTASRHVDGVAGMVTGEVRATGAPLPLECDGESLGDVTCARYGVAPGALRVLASAGARLERPAAPQATSIQVQ